MAFCDISIHAPVKGATQGIPGKPGADGNFNPRPREGSDHTVRYAWGNKTDFNPRPREGSDETIKRANGLDVISIHAPVKGATQ